METQLHRFAHAALHVLEHRATKLAMGLILLAVGLDDLLEAASGSEGAVALDVHHGIIAFGLKQVLHPIFEFLEGAAHSLKASVHHPHE